jgi:hypothetical protein
MGADGTAEAHFRPLFRIVKYAIDTEQIGLVLQPELNNDGCYLAEISDRE